jgi:hypothetical protein
LWRHLGRACRTALQAAFATKLYRCRVLPSVRVGLLGFASGKIDNQLPELVWVARALA